MKPSFLDAHAIYAVESALEDNNSHNELRDKKDTDEDAKVRQHGHMV